MRRLDRVFRPGSRHGAVHLGMAALVLVVLYFASSRAGLSKEPRRPFTGLQGVTPVWQTDSLLIGVPEEDIRDVVDAGGINIIRGSRTGLTSKDNQGWDQDRPGVLDNAEESENFGAALAAGDFDGDGFPDVAIGVPYETIDGVAGGAVQVFYGGLNGITSKNSLWHQNRSQIIGGVEDRDTFGSALAAGDFNGDGYSDLAIGIPREDVDSVVNAGAVQIIYGSPKGLSSGNNQLWHQDTDGVRGLAEAGDMFGYSLATGDFNGDGYDDLAIGTPGEDIGSVGDAGSVQILYGSSQGLTAQDDQWLDQSVSGVIDDAEHGDNFGYTLAVGDFNGDGYDDLAVGIPYEDAGSLKDSGAVQVFYGSSSGITTNDQMWSQDKGSMQGQAESNDMFGWAVAAGDFNGDGHDDLAVGVPGERLGTLTGAGVVHVIYGTVKGLSDVDNQLWHQDHPSLVNDGAEFGDHFGYSLAAGDFDGDGFDDLAIGAPYEGVDKVDQAGAVQVLYGSKQGITAGGSQWWTQDSPDIVGIVEPLDRWGKTLAILPRVQCPDELYETNDNSVPYDATDAMRRFGGLEIMDDAYICPPGDKDLFQFPVQAGETILVDLASLPADYNLALASPAGTVVEWSSNSGTQDEHIAYTAPQTGNYTVLVGGSSIDQWSHKDGYALRIMVETPTPTPTPTPRTPPPDYNCPDGTYEPNEDFDSAAPLTPGRAVQGYICTPADQDWFRFDVQQGQLISVLLSSLPADYDLWLYAPDGTLVRQSANIGVSDEQFTYMAPIPGSYRVRVTGYKGAYSAKEAYELLVVLSSPGKEKIYLPMVRRAR